MLGFRFIGEIVNLSYITLLVLITFQTVVDTGRRPGRLVEKRLETKRMSVEAILVGLNGVVVETGED